MTATDRQEGGGISAAALGDVATLDQLRRYTFEVAGAREAPALLYRIGFDRGWADGEAVADRFVGRPLDPASLPAPAGRILFLPSEGRIPDDFGGVLVRSAEAHAQLRSAPETWERACHLTAGYAAGWYSMVLGEPILVFEEGCAAAGASACRFRARRWSAFVEDGDLRVLRLARHLEPPRQAPFDPEERADAMLGDFDPLSPVAHVWGRVMVLPYAGVRDGDVAFETVRSDLGDGAVRVVILDLTGLRTDTLDVCGMLDLLSRLGSRGLDLIVAGIPAERLLPGDAPRFLGGVLVVRDLYEAIARAFQIAAGPEQDQ